MSTLHSMLRIRARAELRPSLTEKRFESTYQCLRQDRVVEFGRRIAAAGYDLVSTGGTHRTLTEEGGLNVRQVADVTGSPEILDGRVKTLHPVIHGGLLARRESPEQMTELSAHGIETIDLVVVNLYPFAATISRPDVTLDDALENIDIGGPTMLRAAAKNFPSVAVVVDPADYEWVADKLSGID